MFLDEFDTKLLRPLCSPNARVYASTLWMLYGKMVVNWFQSDWTPKDCRESIHRHLLELNQTVNWSEELSFVSKFDQQNSDDIFKPTVGTSESVAGMTESDDANQIYRYLRFSGWIREIEEIGYRRVAYMPKQASGLLVAFDDLTRLKRSNIGARCQNIYLALQQAIDDPRANALQVEVAADHARDFCTQLGTMAASCRELAHGIIEETNTSVVLSKFFNDFINGSLLEDYSKLKSRDHPYRFRAATLELVNKTLVNTAVMQALTSSLNDQKNVAFNDLNSRKATQTDQIQTQLRKDLTDIYQCFLRVDEIMQKIEHYRCAMTRRTREAMQYAMSAPVGLTAQLDIIIEGLAQHSADMNDVVNIPNPMFREQLFAYPRAYRPRQSKVAAAALPLESAVIPEDAIAMNRAMDVYYWRRTENSQRLRVFLEAQFSGRDVITTDQISINSLDDFIAFLQLRDLLHDAVPPSSPFFELLDDYAVEPGESNTQNKYVVAPQLVVRRRRKVLGLMESSLV